MNKKILFVCSANKDRSKTAEDYFSEKFPELSFESAGTNIELCRKLGTNELNNELQNWADVIFVMEKKHFGALNKNYKNKAKILNIADYYIYNQKELLSILDEKLKNLI